MSLLDTLVRNYNPSLRADILSPLLEELPPIVSESDLHIALLTLARLTSISPPGHTKDLQVSPAQVLKLAESPLLQGGALSAMLEFFKTIVSGGVSGLGHSDLLALLGAKGGNIHKAGRTNIVFDQPLVAQ